MCFPRCVKQLFTVCLLPWLCRAFLCSFPRSGLAVLACALKSSPESPFLCPHLQSYLRSSGSFKALSHIKVSDSTLIVHKCAIQIQFICRYEEIQFSQHHLLKQLSSLQRLLFDPCENAGGCGYVSLFLNSLFLPTGLHIKFLWKCYAVLSRVSVMQFEIRYWHISSTALSARINLGFGGIIGASIRFQNCFLFP